VEKGDGGQVRELLLAAMTEVAASEGYAGASVGRIIERAGVSRGTFYAQFDDREECFLAAYRSIVARARAATGGAARAAGASDGVRAAMEALLDQVVADPAAARLVLLEANAAPRGVRSEHEALIREVENAFDRLLIRDPRPETLQIPVTGLRSTIEDIAAIRLLRGESSLLPSLLEDLLAWMDAYRLPSGMAPRSQEDWVELGSGLPPQPPRDRDEPALLPRGRSALAPSSAATQRRGRILEATIKVTAAQGYRGLTVAQIASAARVTKGAFYSHFQSKLEAFLAAQRMGFQEALTAAAEVFYVQGEWPERIWSALREFLRYIAEHPESAVLGVTEVHAAGEAAIRLEHDTRAAFTLFLEEGHRERRAVGPPLPPITAEAIAGANYGLLRRQVVTGQTAYAMRLAPQLAYVTLAPFLGPARAIDFIEEQVRAAR
jgi:AcrR family transcriptional regulator